MITTTEILILLLVAFAAWFWWNSLKAREHAERIAVVACKREDVQFLDGTVALRRLGLARDPRGRLQIKREYSFEFSGSGDERRAGSITLVGHIKTNLYMDLPEGPTITLH